MNRIEFKVGQKVVALTTLSDDDRCFRQNIIKGKVYTVKSIQFCPKCGIQEVNVLNQDNYGLAGVCTVCKFIYRVGTVRTTDSRHFAPLDNLEVSISEAVANEDYETAQVLHDLMTTNLQEA